ncbi:MAG TPA: hypothetical protein VF120_17200 [Ktedonobacterales bacterium]
MHQTERYDADLEQALRQEFHALYGDPPPVASTWTQVSARLAAPAVSPIRAQGSVLAPVLRVPIRTRRRLSVRGALALGVFLLLVTAAATYSASQLLRPLLTVPAAQGRVYTQIHQSKTLGGVTITVEQAVADHDDVIIGITAERPCAVPMPACGIALDAPLLTIQGGQAAKPRVMESDGAYWPGKQVEAYVLYYAPPKLAGQPTSLSLHLAVRLLGDAAPSEEQATFDFTLPYSARA